MRDSRGESSSLGWPSRPARLIPLRGTECTIVPVGEQPSMPTTPDAEQSNERQDTRYLVQLPEHITTRFSEQYRVGSLPGDTASAAASGSTRNGAVEAAPAHAFRGLGARSYASPWRAMRALRAWWAGRNDGVARQGAMTGFPPVNFPSQ